MIRVGRTVPVVFQQASVQAEDSPLIALYAAVASTSAPAPDQEAADGQIAYRRGMGLLSEIVVDCHKASELARFWAGVIDGYAVRAYDDAEIARLASLGLTPATDPTVAVEGPGPTLFFREVPEGKTSKNRVHLEIKVSDRAGEVERLTTRGATVIDHFDTWTVLQDPEGNEFCLSDQR